VVKGENIGVFEGLEVKEKIVMLNRGGLPKGVNFNELKGKQGDDWEFPVNAARKRGAKGAIFIPDFRSLAVWDRSRQTLTERGFSSVDKFQTQNNVAFPTITASPILLLALLPGE